MENSGFGKYSGNPDVIADTVCSWLASPEKLENMQKAALEASRPQATLDIAKDVAAIVFDHKEKQTEKENSWLIFCCGPSALNEEKHKGKFTVQFIIILTAHTRREKKKPKRKENPAFYLKMTNSCSEKKMPGEIFPTDVARRTRSGIGKLCLCIILPHSTFFFQVRNYKTRENKIASAQKLAKTP